MIPYKVLEDVNYKVNNYLKYTSDRKGFDLWNKAEVTESLKTGDCEDYAIVKASRLVHLYKCNPDDMSIGKFRTKNDYHAMLIVKGEKKKGFFKRELVPCLWILDNRTNNIYTIDQIRDKLILQYRVDAFI